MNDPISVFLPLLAGLVVGLVFFGGLWWTVRKGLTSNQPAIWFVVSQIVRVAFTLVTFYFVGRGSWQRLLLCLGGFLIARAIITYMTRIPSAISQQNCNEKREASHATQSR